MRNKLSIRVSSLAMAVAISAAFVPVSANALTLMDILRGRNKMADRPPIAQQESQPKAQPRTYSVKRVAPPKYYTYKPSALRLVSINEIRDTLVTGSIEPQVESAAVEVATLDPSTVTEGVSVEQKRTITNGDPRRYLTDAHVKTVDDVATAIENYYSNGGDLIWVADGGIAPKANLALNALGDAAEFGLNPDDYRVTRPDLYMLSGDVEARDAALMQFELELSAKVLNYIQDAKRGRIDPNRISEFHDLPRAHVALDEAVNALASTENVQRLMENYNPQSERFQELKTTLADLRNDSTDIEPIVFERGVFIHPGDNKSSVPKVVEAIKRKGSEPFLAEHAVVLATYDGGSEYTPELVDLVRDFQRSQGLGADGVVGPATIRAFDVESNDDRARKVKASMERLRWLPDDWGARYVLINQPAYRVYYHQDGGENFDMGVVVGNPVNQTNFFYDEIETVEFNPYWGVPRSIIVNEYLPKLRANPSYFDQRGYEVSYNGRRVSSASVNWDNAPRVDVRQRPGPHNALGELKILFPNDHAIYMHDTPQKSYFKRDTRALSHGCVRLADPRKMAAAVLGVAETDIDANIATGQNLPVAVPEKFPVYVSYFTAWPDESGNVQYYDDVYKRDMYLQRAFDAEDKVRSNV